MKDRPRSTRARPGPAQWALLAASVLLTGLAIEGVLRFSAMLEHRRHLRALAGIGTVELVPETGSTKLGHIIRRSEHPRLIYELKPNLDVRFISQSVRTNGDGMRSPAITTQKPAGTVRVLGLGDSLMFGWGVGADECYLRVMEEKLRFRYPEVAWQVVNCGVPGYNTAMEVEQLIRRGLEFDPDVVMIEFVGNDLDLPNFIWLRTDYLSLRRSLLMEVFRKPQRGSGPEGQTELVEAPLAANGKRYARGRLRTPARYRSMVGVGAYRSALRELARLGREHGFATAVVSLHRAPGYVLDAASENWFPVVDADRGIRTYLEEHDLKTYYPSPLTIGPRDPHPSPITHRIQATAYLEGLEEAGIIKTLVDSVKESRRTSVQGENH